MSFKKNISWSFVGNFVYAACKWGTLAVLAKIGLPQDVGMFSFGLAVCAPVFAFWNLQMKAIQATDSRNEYGFTSYLYFRITTTFVALFLIVVFLIVSDYSTATKLVILIIGVAKGLESISDICHGLFQKNEKMALIAKSQITNGLLTLFLVGMLFLKTRRIEAACFGLILSWIAVLIFLDLKNVKRFRHISENSARRGHWVSGQEFKKLFFLALPMGVLIMMNNLMLSIPKFQIMEIYKETGVGFYSAISSLIVVGSVAVGAVGQTVLPRLAVCYYRSIKEYKLLLIKMTGLSTLVGGAGVVFSIIFGKWMLIFLFTKEYGNHHTLLVMVMVAGALMYISAVLGTGLTAARSFYAQTIVTFFTTITVYLSGLYFIPKYGLIGGAFALTSGYGIKIAGQLIQIGLLTKVKYT